MEIVIKKISELTPYSKNPRKNDDAVEYVANSIKEFGFKVPVVIDSEGVIVAGHTRVKAAEKLKLDEVPCIIADDLTEEQIKAFRLADNKVSEVANWDCALLDEELQDINDIDMSIFGFDMSAFDEAAEIHEDDFDEKEVTENRAKLGDIWDFGGVHKLICGDSTDKAVIEKLLNGVKPDVVFTDPPYQLIATGGGILKKANSMKQIIENKVDTFDPSRLEMWSETNIFCHNKPLIKAYIELAEKNKMPYDLAFYKKKNTVPNYKGHLMTDVEYIAIIGKQDPNKGLDKEMYSKCFIGQKDSDNELSYSKPVALCAKYIQLYSKDNVLDLFGGSGSTLIACEELGRRCYMCEIDPHYCDVIITRWEKFTGKKAELINV